VTPRSTGTGGNEGDVVKNDQDVSQYEQVITRLLAETERPYPAGEARTPLVIQAKSSSDPRFVKTFLAAHADRIRKDIYNHGAVLLRGFKIASPQEFEDILSAIPGFSPMKGYFMAELGRDPVKGTGYVFDTNTFFISGGDFRFGGIHSENYYSTDVPQFQCFCCLKRPWIGGETALFHMANAYGALRDRLSAKLEPEAFVANAIPLQAIADQYGLSEADVEAFLNENGVEVIEWNGRKTMLNRKPSILCHPHTGRPSLQINLSRELKDLESDRHFLPGYTGSKWAVHRLAWKRPRLLQALTYTAHLSRAVRHPSLFWQFVLVPLGRRLMAPARKQPPQKQPPPTASAPALPRIGHRLDAEDQKLLGRTVWEHSSVFTWQPGDLLIVDNLQMHHAGMPGFGPRDIKVMLSNPISVTPRDSAGVYQLSADEAVSSLHERLSEFARRNASRSVSA
jgi:alpha-ketoglutarate-dependent taurine dioxygenase